MRRQMMTLLLCGFVWAGSIPVSAQEQSVPEAFDAYLDRIYADWLQDSPFDIHYYLEHPEVFDISIERYVLEDYEGYE